MKASKRVALGMSGGVDSSVAVAVLLEQDYDVVGVTCMFQKGEAAERAIVDAREVCGRFGIAHAVRDCTEDFERYVTMPFAEGYAAGLTPSPCVNCNAYVKVPSIVRAADDLECGFVATGHYARVNRMSDSGRYAVLAALDVRKDQSYMLCSLSQEQLARLILPLGGLTKAEVRIAAADLGLAQADAAESQDICFAPHGYRAFLAERGVMSPPGDIENVFGEVLGRHTGLSDYTVGQRKGIGIAGPEPYYVIAKRACDNVVVVGTGEQSRIGSCMVSQMNWQAIEGVREPLHAMVKLRYRSKPCACIIKDAGEGRVRVELSGSQPTTAPGQFAVFYQGATVLGGGVIEEVGA